MLRQRSETHAFGTCAAPQRGGAGALRLGSTTLRFISYLRFIDPSLGKSEVPGGWRKVEDAFRVRRGGAKEGLLPGLKVRRRYAWPAKALASKMPLPRRLLIPPDLLPPGILTGVLGLREGP